MDPSSSSTNMDLNSYKIRLSKIMHSVKPGFTRPQSTDVSVHPASRASIRSLVRYHSLRRPIEMAYQVPF